jgi:hypothetical protein
MEQVRLKNIHLRNQLRKLESNLRRKEVQQRERERERERESEGEGERGGNIYEVIHRVRVRVRVREGVIYMK